MKQNDQNWLKEYESFLQSDATPVPKSITETVMTRMQALIHPSAWIVFLKVLAIHTGVGTLSLAICHQFGMNPFQTNFSIADWAMAMWGHGACMVVCGTVFVGLSFLAAGTFLSIEEIRALRRTEFLQTLAIGVASLAIFALVGAELVLTFSALWLVGAFVGGLLATESIWRVRRAMITSRLA